MSVLNPLGFVSLKLHYTPKHRHRIQGCPRRNSQCFLCKPGSGLSFSHCIKRWRNNHVLTAKCNALLIRTWQLSCHTCIWSAPVADSNTLTFLSQLPKLPVFSPSLYLSFCRSLFLSSGQAGGRSDKYFSPSSIYSFCSDGASHTLWFIFTSSLQGIMEVLVLTVCAHI